jgi:hypothetical protein
MAASTQAKIADPLPWSEEITPYDKIHFVTYLRLLDAKSAGVSDHDICRRIFDLDLSRESEKASRILCDHLRRARWMTETGYKALLRQDV